MMTKKQMEERIQELEKRIVELQSQMLALSLRQPIQINPLPIQPPAGPSWPTMPTWPSNPGPYFGDPIYPNPIITCGILTSSNKTLGEIRVHN